MPPSTMKFWPVNQPSRALPIQWKTRFFAAKLDSGESLLLRYTIKCSSWMTTKRS